MIVSCLGVAAAVLALQFTQAEVKAGLFDQCNPCDEAAACDPCEQVSCGSTGKWFVNGHVESGFWANAHGQRNAYDAATNGRHGFDNASANTGLLQNVQNTGYQVNQVYVSAGKSVDGTHGWDLGGTVDFVWGTDARFVQSNGLERANGHDVEGWGTGDYYSAFAQAYFEAAYKKLNVKVGKFYAPFGSQPFKSTDSFFYSFAPTYGFVPATAGGAYATYTVSDKLSVYGGWVQPDQFGETKDDNAFLGGVIVKANKKRTFHYAFAKGENHYAANSYDYFVNSLVLTTQETKRLRSVLDWSYSQTRVPGNTDTIWGLNNEWIYQYTDKLSFGLRLASVRGGGYPAYSITGVADDAYAGIGENTDWYTISAGWKYDANKWLTIRSEIRYDVVDGASAFNNGFEGNVPKDYQFSGGLSTIVKF
ncbi:MAG: porin [Planctomycetaceae bacterium]|nr:porin [Planctomycetaceae bacterium]